MISLKRSAQKPTVIAPQIQRPFRINPPESENKLSITPAPRKYKKSKAIQTDKSELINPSCEQNIKPNFDDVIENLKLKYDKSKSVRLKINNQHDKNIVNNKTKPINQEEKTQEFNTESVRFTPFIEFDMHGGDYHISDPFDWIQIIREILIEAENHQIDMIKFIPGQGKHTNLSAKQIEKPKDPILRPLTLVTTKMLNYNSYIDITNRGVVICPIPKIGETTSNTEINKKIEDERRELIFNVFLGSDSFDIQNEDLIDKKDEMYDEKIKVIKTFKEVKKEVPNLLDSCIEIISVWKKEAKDAIEFAQTFMDKFNGLNTKRKKQLKRAKMKDDKKRDDEKINIMRLVNKYQQKYGFDQIVIQRIVEEQRTEEKCEKVFDKIYHDMLLPYIFFRNNFSSIVSENETIPVTSLLATFKECEYMPHMIRTKMCSQSYKDIGDALRLMKVNTNINSKRSFNEFFNQHKIDIPKYVPSIEVNLENAGTEKALISIGRVMDGLSIGEFCEMILIFSQKENTNRCSIDSVRPFIEQKAINDGYELYEKENRNIYEYHFYIINNRNITTIEEDSNSNE